MLEILFGAEVQDWDPTDTNKDGNIDSLDIPFEPGSLEAKKAWQQIEAIAHSPENIAKAKSLGYENARGWYAGGPLVPGAGSGHKDYQLLVDKLHFFNGYDIPTAEKIAAKARWMSAK